MTNVIPLKKLKQRDVWYNNSYTLSSDKNRLDIHMILNFLQTESYWAQDITLAELERAIDHSVCFGLYNIHGNQVGFARVVTDYRTIAYVGDIFLLKEYRGKGLGKWMTEILCTHKDLQKVKRWLLATRDRQDFYKHFGFTDVKKPEIYMEKSYIDIFKPTSVLK